MPGRSILSLVPDANIIRPPRGLHEQHEAMVSDGNVLKPRLPLVCVPGMFRQRCFETLLERLEGKRKRRSVRWSYKSEGIVAGLIGAATIAVWFLLLDALNGRPLHTPTVLGTALFRHGTGLDAPDRLSTSAEMVLMYTWVHALVFCVIGVVASKLIVLVERNPEIGFGSFLFFCFFQFGFIIAAFIFAEPVLYILAWPNILGGNLLASGTMVAYFWRRHPKLVIQP